ncbi:diacylglycerol kinase family protein [Devosia sp.]|uniref:diacylglycerol/lipid kinase family protein n=1 Tax=Devosia sp. TaxID=1871048 RepID=UPI0032668911
MQRSRFFIVHNSRAGRNARVRYDAVLANLYRAGASIDIVETVTFDNGVEVAAAAALTESFDTIVAAGGDGTVRSVATGILGRPTPLGIIPTGTADVYARELGMPRNPAALAQVLLQGRQREIPVGEIDGRLFLFVVGVGFDAEAASLFEARGHRVLGRTGLAWSAIEAIFMSQYQQLKLETENGNSDARWIIATRTKRYAAGRMLAPDANPLQEQFYVLHTNGKYFARVVQLAALGIGLFRNVPGLTVEAVRWVKITGDPRTAVQIDGEVTGGLPLEIRVHNKKLAVILPKWAT